jgi:hypothetical protein
MVSCCCGDAAGGAGDCADGGDSIIMVGLVGRCVRCGLFGLIVHSADMFFCILDMRETSHRIYFSFLPGYLVVPSRAEEARVHYSYVVTCFNYW